MPVSTIIENEEYLNTTEAARYLGIARETFKDRAKRWELAEFEDPYHTVATLYKKSDLEKYKGLPLQPKKKEKTDGH